MKSEVKLTSTIPWDYPCLAHEVEDKWFIVLFSSEGKGTVVRDTKESVGIGEYAEDWDMNHFTPLHPGSQVILTQE